MIRAIIFDFNGVLADDEASHVLCFQQALAEYGLSLTSEEYYGTYLGMDERTCATRLLTERDGRCDVAQLGAIIERKASLFRDYTAFHTPPLFPGVIEFVKKAGSRCRLAVASGGRREQIQHALSGTPIEQDFEVMVTADDCAIGKPDPAIYLLTLQRLNDRHAHGPVLMAHDCLVIEDSKAGIQAGRAAGMTVLALATTYPAEQLREADLILPTLEHIEPDRVCSLSVTHASFVDGATPGNRLQY